MTVRPLVASGLFSQSLEVRVSLGALRGRAAMLAAEDRTEKLGTSEGSGVPYRPSQAAQTATAQS